MSEKSKLQSLTRQQTEGIVFFIILFLYLWLVVDLRLVPSTGGFVAKFPVFYRGWDFFSNTCSMPGGPLDYLSSFLVQFFYFAWAGAITVTLQAWLIYFFTGKFLDVLKMSNFSRVSFAGPIIVLALYNKYLYFFNIASGILLSLVLAYVYILLTEKQKSSNCLLIFLILSLFLYPIAGGSILMFVLLCMIYELLIRSRLMVVGTELLTALVVVFCVGVGLYHIDNIEAFTRLLPIHYSFEYIYSENTQEIVVACILYLFLPLIFLGSWLAKRIPAPSFLHSKSNSSRNTGNLSHREDIKFLILLMVASLTVYFTYSPRDKNFYAADYYANQRDWRKALMAAESAIDHPLMICIANRALYHTGRLPNDIFMYPQQNSGLFYSIIVPRQYFSGVCQATDLCIDLGLINDAEQYAWVKLESYGPLPQILKRLATIMMVKGDMDSAKVYLNLLSKTLFHADWAKEYLAKLDSDSDLSSDPYIQHLRSIMIKTDFILGDNPGGSWILNKLLESNRYNRMAFEYLMAKNLLEKHPAGIVDNLHRLEDFHYTETPKSYEEAFFLCLSLRGGVRVPDKFQVSAESQARFNSFDNFMRRNIGGLPAIEKEVITNYRNTYYEYFFYGYKHNVTLTE